MTGRASLNLNGQIVLADTWQYDAASNVTQANDSAQGYFNYTYDPMDRVTMGSTSNESTNYGYDPWGNQTNHTVTAGSNFEWSFTPSLQNQATLTGAQYDASGNMTADGLHSYTYDAEGQLAGVTDQGVGYRYGPDDLRVATLTGASVTAEYLYDLDSQLVTTVNSSGALVRTILRANGTHYGDYTSGTGSGGGDTEFRLVNQVGTLVANGDSNGNYVEGCLSGPYGDAQDCTPSYDYTETHFSDKLRDQETTNDYFGARYYSSTLGRFLSPDDGDGGDSDPRNPQSWNLYSYVLNNPLTNTDPDGHSVQVCTTGSDGSQDCSLLSNDQYQAAQQAGNGGLNVPSLNSVGTNGSGSITDANGNTVGTATYSADNPGIDPFVNGNSAGYNTLANASRDVTAGTAIYAVIYAGAACAVACPGGVAAVLATARNLYYAAAGLLPAVPSALEKLQKLGLSVSEANELIESPTTQKLVDNANSGNINYVADVAGKLVRITTDPNGQRIISAGLMRANQVTNGISSGRFTK